MSGGLGILTSFHKATTRVPKAGESVLRGTGNWKVEKFSHPDPAGLVLNRSSLEDNISYCWIQKYFGKASILNIFRIALLIMCIISTTKIFYSEKNVKIFS